MFNLLKSDLYRLVHGKMLWITLVILLVCISLGTGLLAFAASPEFAQMVNAAAEMDMDDEHASITDVNVSNDGDVHIGGVDKEGNAVGVSVGKDGSVSMLKGKNGDGAEANASEMASDDLYASVNSELTAEELQALSAKTFRSLSYATAQMALTGGLLGILSGLVVGLFVMGDFASGFAKVILSSRKSRAGYYAEKLVLSALISAVYVIAAIAFIGIVNAIAGFTYNPGESAGELVLWALLTWLVLTAYNFIVAVIAWLSRSKVATVLAAVFVSSTVIESFILEIITFASSFFPLLEKATWLFPASCIKLLGQGSAGLLDSQAGLLFPFLSPAVQITLICAVYIAVFIALALSACKRKDVYYR